MRCTEKRGRKCTLTYSTLPRHEHAEINEKHYIFLFGTIIDIHCGLFPHFDTNV